MNITLNGTKITQDTRNLAFEKNSGVDEIVITVDTDESWSYKLDVKYPDKYNVENDALYNIIDLNRNGIICSVILTREMLPFNGKYTMQLRGINGDKVYHSDTFEVWVKYSIEPGSTYNPVPSEFYQVEARLDDKVDEAKKYAENAETASTRMPKISPDNTWLIWDVETGDYVDTGIKASGGTSDHSKLINRGVEDQHPMSAITGLEKALDGKQPAGDYLTQDDLQGATNAALAQAKASGDFDGPQGDPGAPGTDGKSAYQYAVEGGYTGTEEEFAAKLAQEMPTTLPNPNALTFTGAVTGSYDGSAPMSIEIPSGGGSAGNSGQWEYIGEFTEANQPTFESGKYRFFYVEAFFTSDNTSSTTYRFPCIDGYGYCRWAFANAKSQKIRMFVAHGLCAIIHATNGTTYPTHTDRGSTSLHPAVAQAESVGTAFWVATDPDNYPISTFGIKLWGAK